jgi:hypothetical protein
MSASVTSMHDFIEALRSRVPRDIHPMALAIIREDFCAMHDAAADPQRVVQLAAKVRWRIVDELRWEAVKSATVHDFRAAYKLRHRADRIEASHA